MAVKSKWTGMSSGVVISIPSFDASKTSASSTTNKKDDILINLNLIYSCQYSLQSFMKSFILDCKES